MKTLRYLFTTILIVSAISIAFGRTRTTQRNLSTNSVPITRIESDSTLNDSAAVNQDAVSLRGYSKRASDSRETFFITNNSKTRMSHVKLKFQYSTMNGEVIHERVVTVEVNLNPGDTRLAGISSWDKQRMFYYHGGPKPRKSATPYRVAFALVGYTIPVGN